MRNGACSGCPPRRPYWAISEVIGINLCTRHQLAFKPADEKIYYKTYPKIWWNNISYGFEWDDNTFMINQWGHPYQVAPTSRRTGQRPELLGIWSLSAFGALTWKYLAERHKPSLNDLIMTTLGGSPGRDVPSLGVAHQGHDDTGKSRMAREIIATVFDPVTGINRFLDRDALKVVEKPSQYVPSALVAAFDVGVLWRERPVVPDATGNRSSRRMSGTAHLARSIESAFDAFVVDMRFGGGGGGFRRSASAGG